MVEKYIFGIDIGGTTCKAGLFLEKGELLEKWEFPTDISNQGEQILPKVALEIQHKLAEYEIKQIDVVGVGMFAINKKYRNKGYSIILLDIIKSIALVEKSDLVLECLYGQEIGRAHV